jgi:hypothetical protein
MSDIDVSPPSASISSTVCVTNLYQTRVCHVLSDIHGLTSTGKTNFESRVWLTVLMLTVFVLRG